MANTAFINAEFLRKPPVIDNMRWVMLADLEKVLELAGCLHVDADRKLSHSILNRRQQLHIYPSKLEDLLEDKRHLSIKRHIRTLYANPFTNDDSWKALPAPGGGIHGIEYQRRDSDYPVTKQFVFIPATSGSR